MTGRGRSLYTPHVCSFVLEEMVSEYRLQADLTEAGGVQEEGPLLSGVTWALVITTKLGAGRIVPTYS